MIATMTMNAAVTVILTVTATVNVNVTVNVNANVNATCFDCYRCIQPSLGYARRKFSIFLEKAESFPIFQIILPFK